MSAHDVANGDQDNAARIDGAPSWRGTGLNEEAPFTGGQADEMFVGQAGVFDDGSLGPRDPNDQALEDKTKAPVELPMPRRFSVRYEDDREDVVLPKSTYSLLFTEPVISASWMGSVVISTISLLCLTLALVENLESVIQGNDVGHAIPSDVKSTTRIAQYVAILVGLLIEEEVPTAVFLLRNIPRESLEERFPAMQYSRFVAR